jgi:hypothetical protein
MATALNLQPENWDGNRNEFISQKMEDLHRILQMYSPTYDVVFNPEGRMIGGEPYNFAILESSPGREPYIVRYLKTSQLDNPTELRDWVAAGDTRRHRPDDIIARIEFEEAVKREERAKIQQAKLEADRDFTASAVRGGINKLHTYKHRGRKYE